MPAKTTKTSFIALYAKFPNSSKTFTSVQLADALRRAGKSTCLIDGDTDNANRAGTAFKLLSKKPRRGRGFHYTPLDKYSKGEFQFGILDTSRQPNESVEKTVVEDCDLIILPVMVDSVGDPEEKSIEEGLKAVWDLRELDPPAKVAVLLVLRNGASRDDVEKRFLDIRATVLSQAIYDEALASRLLSQGDLLVDCDAADSERAIQAESRFDALAAEVLAMVVPAASVTEIAKEVA